MKSNKMLFFDIECANVFNDICKMCSFGYVITDDKFNVIEKKDIIINPESEYDFYLFKKNSKTKLAHSKEYYNKHQNFESNFQVIRDILEDDYIGIFGFEVLSDLKYIYDSCNRYDLKTPEIESYDVRKMLMEHDKSIKGGLVSRYKQAFPEIEVDDIHHESVDDAYMTSMLLKQVCNKMNINIYEYLKHTKVSKRSFDIDNHLEKIKTKQFRKEYNKYRNVINENPLNNRFKGVKYSISAKLQKDYNLTLSYIKELYEGNGVMITNTTESDFMIAKDQEDIKNLKEILENHDLKILLYSDLLLLYK